MYKPGLHAPTRLKPRRRGNNADEVMDLGNANLVVLIESDAEACRYFLSLPEDVRARLAANPNGIGNLADLRTRADQLMGGG